MLRLSIGCFVATAVAYVLQLFPLTGVFLMMLAAPFWSVILINLGFLALLAEAWKTPDLRWLAVFPIAWFGGYFGVAFYSHRQADQYDREISAANTQALVPFDSKSQDILIVPDVRDSSNGSPLTAGNLIASFDLNRAYQVENPSSSKVQEYALREAECPGRGGVGVSGELIWSRLYDGGFGTGRRMTSADGLCHFVSFKKPSLPVVRIFPQKQSTESGLITRVSQDIEIREPIGKITVLRSGWAVPLAWFPQPIMGCWLNSGAPQWVCNAAFAHQSIWSPNEDRTPNSPDKVVGKALGLAKLTVRQRYPNLSWK